MLSTSHAYVQFATSGRQSRLRPKKSQYIDQDHDEIIVVGSSLLRASKRVKAGKCLLIVTFSTNTVQSQRDKHSA